jgi:hypothetical protein
MSLETARLAANAIIRQTDVNLIAAASAKALMDLIDEVERLKAELAEVKGEQR